MGLLDMIPDLLPQDPQKREAAKMGLLQMGAQMLAGRGNFGQVLGQGLLGGANAYGQQMEAGKQDELRKMQLQQGQMQLAQMKQQQARQQAQDRAFANMPMPKAAQGQLGHEMASGYDAQPLPMQPVDPQEMQAYVQRNLQHFPAIANDYIKNLMIPKAAEWKEFKKPNADGTVEHGFVNMNAPDPLATFRAGGTAPVKNEYVDGTPVNPYTNTQAGSVIPKRPDAPNPGRDLLIPDGKGGYIVNKSLFDVRKSLAKAGAPNMTSINNVAAFEPFANRVQGKMGESLVDSFNTLQSIPQTLSALEAAKANLAKAGNFVGSGADVKLNIAKFFNNNFGTTIDPTGVANTEALQSALFYNVMDNLKKMDASPSQEQQRTMQAAFGRINTDPGALPMIIDFYRNQIISKGREHNRRVDETEKGPSGIRFPYDIRVKVPDDKPAAGPQSGANLLPALPPANASNKGKTAIDHDTGKKYKSNGIQWVPQ